MTNAEKYLKDGVDIEKLADEILKFNAETFERERTCFNDNLEKFFKQQAQPTLTEDERVILRCHSSNAPSKYDDWLIKRTKGSRKLRIFFREKKTGEERILSIQWI